MSQGHSGAGVFELAGQHSSVELVELHQVDQVRELGGAIVEAEEHLAVFLTLQTRARGKREDRLLSRLPRLCDTVRKARTAAIN